MGNNNQPKPKSWSKTKCLEWLSNNPIKNDVDYQYINDTVIKLIQSVSSSNQEHERLHSTNIPGHDKVAKSPIIGDLQFDPITPLSSSSTIPIDSHLFLKANSRQNWAKSVKKRNRFMDTGTFKLVIEHQKEYSLQVKKVQSHNLATIKRKNLEFLLDSRYQKCFIT